MKNHFYIKSNFFGEHAPNVIKMSKTVAAMQL